MKYDVVVADPPWPFSDKLRMSKVKRGAEDQYKILSVSDIKKLKVEEVSSPDAVLALWVPSSMLQEGLDVMEAWGFEQKQTFIWVKHKKLPLGELSKEIKAWGKRLLANEKWPWSVQEEIKWIGEFVNDFDVNQILAFYMGRLFRQTHEVALIGVRGKVYDQLQNKSQRSVLLDINFKHSAKPEGLQNRLDLMFPNANKLEMFARRDRDGWTCVGLECPATPGEDIRVSLENL